MARKESRETLEARLARETREANALREWFLLSEVLNLRNGGAPHTVTVAEYGYVVHLRGFSRACGGVAVVARGDFRDFPRYVDDLTSEWLADANPHIRAAAARIQTLREDVLAGKAA